MVSVHGVVPVAQWPETQISAPSQKHPSWQSLADAHARPTVPPGETHVSVTGGGGPTSIVKSFASMPESFVRKDASGCVTVTPAVHPHVRTTLRNAERSLITFLG